MSSRAHEGLEPRTSAYESAVANAPAPGKRALTDRLPIQRRAASLRDTPAAHSTREPVSHPATDDPFALHLVAPVQARGALAGDDLPAVAALGIGGASTALPHAATIQAAFGHHDVGGIQAYVGGAATDAAHAIGATAYATGNSVAFASAPDLHLAAHEAAHVVQQRAGVHLRGNAGEVGDAYEQHADAVADAVVRGQSAEQLLDATPRGGATSHAAVQRFGGEEHKVMGDTATKGERLREFADLGIDLSFGDGVMISGDVLGYLESEQPKDPHQPQKTTVDYLRDRLRNGGKEGRDEVRWAVWFARSEALRGPEPDVPEAIKARIRSRYLKLAKENVNHFSHGGTARETYLSMHSQACEKAYRSAMTGEPALFEEAKTDEAFAQHYLSDMFAGGHVRTPRGALDRDERNRDMPSIENVVTALAWSIFLELRAMDDFGVIAENPIVPHIIVGKIVAIIKAKGGEALQQGSYAALVSKALHDHDNEGLKVVSARGRDGRAPRDGYRWRAVGDGQILDSQGGRIPAGQETFHMATLAMETSRRELDAAAAAGRSAVDAGFTLESINGGRALEYVPSEIPGKNADLYPNGSAWDEAIDEAVRAEVLPRLLEFFPDVITVEGKRDATIQEGGRTLHVGAAMKRVAAKIDASPSEWLRESMLIAIPNVQSEGPPDVAGVGDGPRDAGVGQ